MTHMCAGCNRRAQLVFKDNDSIGLCIPCTRLLPLGIFRGFKRIQGEEAQCQACGDNCHWGGDYCHECRADVVRYLFRLDKTLLDDNPFVFDLCLPAIRFRQYVNRHAGPEPEDYHSLTLPPVKQWGEQIEYHRISFERLVYADENST